MLLVRPIHDPDFLSRYSLGVETHITRDDVLAVYEVMKKNQYGQYLKDVLDGKYIDVIHERITK